MFKVQTNYPLALTSEDFLNPLGTKDDCSSREEFYRGIESEYDSRPLYWLDLGCAGGCEVFDVIQLGHKAVGLEGSDYSLLRKRARWADIPDNLFTCDCSKPFQILENNKPVVFDIVTAWEFFEHIEEVDLPQTIENAYNHLKDGGSLFASIPPTPDGKWHRTCKYAQWWISLFGRLGLQFNSYLYERFKHIGVRGEPETFFVFTK